MEKILIFGGRGYIAGHLKTIYPDAVLSDVDICSLSDINTELDRVKPDIVINAAGKTGKPNIDWCEDHKLETLMSNVTGPLNLLDACSKRSMYWVHIGSGCIYEGDNDGKGFGEDDPPNYDGSFYSRTKLWSDQILKDFPVLQMRLRMPFDGTTNPRSLIMKLRKYTRILDTENSIIYIPDFLRAIQTLVAKRKVGTYNIVNPGVITPLQIMKRYKDIVDPLHTFELLPLTSLSEVATTSRSNCKLSTAKLEAEGIRLLPVEVAIDEALHDIAKLRVV